MRTERDQKRGNEDGGSAVCEELLTRRQLAAKANVSVRTIDYWVKRRIIPVICIGRLKRFLWHDVTVALARFRRNSIGQ